MLTQFLFDLRPFEQYVLSFAPALLVFGKAHAMHQQFCMYFLDRFDFHEFLPTKIKPLRPERLIHVMPPTLSQGWQVSKNPSFCRTKHRPERNYNKYFVRVPHARSGGSVISGCFQVHPTALTAGWIQTGPPIKTFGGEGFKSVLVSRAIFKRSHHGHEALVVCACAPSENPATGALNPSTVDGAADKLLQSNSRARAASEIATTAGCLSLRSNEI